MMDTALAPLIAVVGFASYFLISIKLAVYRRYPWEFVAVIAAGAGLGLYRFGTGPGVGSGIAAVVSIGLLALACWYFFSFSMFGQREDRPRIGERFPDFTLPASDGSLFRFAEIRGRRSLILFYRGIW